MFENYFKEIKVKFVFPIYPNLLPYNLYPIAKPIKWNEYVTINLDFSDGEKRGRSLLHANTIVETGGNLYRAEKEIKPADFATFQVISPSITDSPSTHECVKWGDTVVLSVKHNYDTSHGNCAGYGCRVVFYDLTLEHSTVDPFVLRILPPGVLFRSPEQCVLSDDHFVLSPMSAVINHGKPNTSGYHGTKNLQFDDSGQAIFAPGTNLTSDLSFRHIHRFRAIEWKDHVRINTGFESNGENIYGNSVLYTDSLDEHVALKVNLKRNNPQITTFRILSPIDFTGVTRECLSWGDEFMLKLNNDASEDDCATIYGCRLLYTNAANNLTKDPKFGRMEENEEKFYIHSPRESKTGCVRAGEQFYLSQNQDSETQSRVMKIDLTTKTVSFDDHTQASLLAFQVFT
eukprot:Awhi_evm1s4267